MNKWNCLMSKLKKKTIYLFKFKQIKIINRVGIIGQPMKLFHVKTLAARGNEDGAEEGGGEAKLE
jgi:hypothetical protein